MDAKEKELSDFKAKMDAKVNVIVHCIFPDVQVLPLKHTGLHHRPAGDEIMLALHKGKDIITDSIRNHGAWETSVLYVMQHALRVMASRTGKAPVVIDIGANMGTMCVPLAAEGYETHAFEMFPNNVRLLNISRCINSIPASRLQIHHAGLSDREHECIFISDKNFISDATLKCDDRTKPMSHWNAGDVFRDNYIVRGKAQLRRFDSLLDERDLQRKLDEGRPFVVKIDVEGHEIHALRGANRLLSHPNKPRLIHAEAWSTLNCTALAKLMFSYGYIGYAQESQRWVTDLVEAVAWWKYFSAKTNQNNIMWVHPDYAQDFTGTLGIGTIMKPTMK